MDKESIQVINCNKKELGKNWLIAFDPKNTKFLESAEYSGDLNIIEDSNVYRNLMVISRKFRNSGSK